jgi:Domain of unknown function (DUF397)
MANGDCVEVAKLSGGLIGVRDSKDPVSALQYFLRHGHGRRSRR